MEREIEGNDMGNERAAAEVVAAVASSSQKLSARHVCVVIAGILICFGPATLVVNTWSLFVVPVSTALGCASGQFTIMPSIIFLASAAASPFLGNLMEKYDLRIVLSCSVLLCAAGLLLCATYTEIWQFYLSGVIEGIGVVCLLYLAPGTLINRWYKVHIGTLIGVCVAMTGVGGAVWSMCGGIIIGGYGYQAAYLFYGTMCLVLGLIATVLLIRSFPRDIGMRPFGESDDEPEDSPDSKMEWGVAAAKAFKMPAFYLLAITFMLINGIAQAGNMLPTYLYHLSDIGAAGITATTVVIMASVIATCMMVSQFIAKITLGTIADKTIMGALAIACGGGILGVLCAWQGYLLNDILVYMGGVFFGFFFGATNVLGPTITRYLFGQREYTKIYSRVATLLNIFPAFAIMILSALFSVSWDLMFGFVLAAIIVIFICAVLLVRAGKGIEQTYEPRPE